jgi:cytochrome c556
MKTILISFLMIVLTGGVYAQQPHEMEARQELTKTVKRVISDEMSQYKNYFYDRDITTMKEKVEITCLVNENRKWNW